MTDLMMDDPLNPSEISIIFKPDALHNLIERLKHEGIDMNTDFQRFPELGNGHRIHFIPDNSSKKNLCGPYRTPSFPQMKRKMS